MQFKYVGNPLDSLDRREAIVAFGIRFPRDIPVDVPDQRIAKKLMGNNHFVIVDGGTTYHVAPRLVLPKLVLPEDVNVSTPKLEPKSELDPKPIENNDEGSSSGGTLDKANLIATADANNIPIDRRWSAGRIAEAITQAQALQE
jgi:hypothetical protein